MTNTDGTDFEIELGQLIEKWRHLVVDDAILDGLDLMVQALEERRELTHART
jgi:hypothetical protein